AAAGSDLLQFDERTEIFGLRNDARRGAGLQERGAERIGGKRNVHSYLPIVRDVWDSSDLSAAASIRVVPDIKSLRKPTGARRRPLSKQNDSLKAQCFSMPSRVPAGVWARHSRCRSSGRFVLYSMRGNERQCSIPPL